MVRTTQHPTLRAHEIIVLLRVRQCAYGGWTYEEIAREVGLSGSQVYESVRRASDAGLFSRERHEVRVRPLTEFVLHGARYAFPAVKSAATTGWPTASTHPTLASELRASADDSAAKWVWPDIDGPAFGTGLLPLHRAAIVIAKSDASALIELHAQLACFDELRVGRKRGRRLAAERLTWALENPGVPLSLTRAAS